MNLSTIRTQPQTIVILPKDNPGLVDGEQYVMVSRPEGGSASVERTADGRTTKSEVVLDGDDFVFNVTEDRFVNLPGTILDIDRPSRARAIGYADAASAQGGLMTSLEQAAAAAAKLGEGNGASFMPKAGEIKIMHSDGTGPELETVWKLDGAPSEVLAVQQAAEALVASFEGVDDDMVVLPKPASA